MKILIKILTLSEIIVDTIQWTASISEEETNFDVPKFDIKTVGDLALLI